MPTDPHSPTCAIQSLVNRESATITDCTCEVHAEEHRAQCEKATAHAKRHTELMRKHTKGQLLQMAFAGGLQDYNSPARWRKDELASTVLEQQEWREERARAAADPEGAA